MNSAAGPTAPDISIVIPFYNEEENVVPVLQETLAVMRNLAETRGWSFEIIGVDDGSEDQTLDRLLEIFQRTPELRVLHFGVNYGQTAALSAGFHHARGRWTLSMDGDGQNDPADIPRLLEVLEQTDADVVSGWRKDRKDPWLTRRLPSQTANRLISVITGVYLRDYGCTLKAYRSEVLKDLHLYGEMHRFIPALTRWLGARVVELPVRHRPRRRGRSKYGLSRVIRVLLDLLVVKFLMQYSTRPIQFFGLIGLALALLGFLTFLFVIVYKYAFGLTMNRNPLLYVGLTLEMIACQVILMGLLGEMLSRTYHETQHKPIYRIKKDYRHEEERKTNGSGLDPVGA